MCGKGGCAGILRLLDSKFNKDIVMYVLSEVNFFHAGNENDLKWRNQTKKRKILLLHSLIGIETGTIITRQMFLIVS